MNQKEWMAAIFVIFRRASRAEKGPNKACNNAENREISWFIKVIECLKDKKLCYIIKYLFFLVFCKKSSQLWVVFVFWLLSSW